jgi:diadenosine tetraphosphate (Ap4A) HIT family hydrolase
VELADCFACQVSRHELLPPERVFSVSPHWSLNQRVDEFVRPWFVLQTKHHRDDLTALTPAEQDELGRLLSGLCAAIENFTGATRVYVACLNELGHVHFHLVPRYAGDTQLGADLLRTPAPAGIPARVDDAVVAAIAEQAEFDPGKEPHWIVRAIVTAHRWFNARLSPYGPLVESVWRRDPAAFAPVYVLLWLLALAALLAISTIDGLPTWLRVVISAAAAFRWVDAVLYELGVLLDRSQNFLAGFERSVLLAGANLIELSLIGAIWLVNLGWGPTVGPTWLHTFGLVTLSGSPEYTSAAAAIAQALTLGGGLLFLGGAIALLLGALGDRVREVRSS